MQLAPGADPPDLVTWAADDGAWLVRKAARDAAEDAARYTDAALVASKLYRVLSSDRSERGGADRRGRQVLRRHSHPAHRNTRGAEDAGALSAVSRC